MQAAEIRTRFLEYFREQGHEVVPSSPVVPHDDPTLLFANAGMNQFKSVFTGEEKRDYVRAASSQKCIRAGGKHNDLDNVGYTARHLTFFEMLGNFSFGDYFKADACRWAWDLVTNVYKLDAERLWITVYHEDDEARAVWRDEIGVPNERIVGLGEKDNFWSMGDVGPCGPCSEIHFDRGEAASCGPNCGLGKCDCDRYLEFWNLVFMQFEQRADGTRVALPNPSIDTGMGLERITMILQGKESVYETDLLRGIIDHLAKITGVPYDVGAAGTPHRVIADHLRSLAFAIADGAFPSNEGRGYVLRRILRRAARYGYKLGMDRPFICGAVGYLADVMGDAFPELRTQRALIEERIRSEEEQFGRTLKMGMSRFDEEIGALSTGGQFPADAAFFLHDTCGFPIDLTEQMCREKELTVDRPGFDERMEAQRQRSRDSAEFSAEGGGGGGKGVIDIVLGNIVLSETPDSTRATHFGGYSELTGEGSVVHLHRDNGRSVLVLDSTPFYAEGGGQVGDTGVIEAPGCRLKVLDTQKKNDIFFHFVELEDGSLDSLSSGTRVTGHVDMARRREVERNHTATHLVHAALREILGTHVQQKGSLVAPDRLRFDISHFQKVTPEELIEVEKRVQEEILANHEVITGVYPKDEALARGAMAFFGEKYGDEVRVVEIGESSIELCGGAHCARSGDIGTFTIIHEGSVSSGVRRIEALSGWGAHGRVREDEELLATLAQQLRVGRDEIAERVKSLVAENRDLKSGKGAANNRDLLKELEAGAGEKETVGDAEVVSAVFADPPQDELMRISDALKQRPGKRVYILVGTGEGTVKLLVGSSKEVGKGQVHCGNIAKAGAAIVGGGGGGRPDLAQAGGKDVSKVEDALNEMRGLARASLGG